MLGDLARGSDRTERRWSRHESAVPVPCGSLGTLGDELCDHHGANTILRGCVQTWLSPERRAGDGRRPEGRERRSRPP